MNPADLPPQLTLTMRPRDFGLAALGALLVHPSEANAAPEERFLREALAAAGGADWRAQALASLESDAALTHAQHAFGLSAIETLALALVAAVEDDPLACRVIAWMQAPQPSPRPALALLARAFAPLHESFSDTDPLRSEAATLHALAYGRAMRLGLLQAEEPNAARPLCETALRVPAPIAAALAGVACDWPGAQTPTLWPVAPVPALQAALADWARDLAAMPRSGLVIRSAAPHEAVAWPPNWCAA